MTPEQAKTALDKIRALVNTDDDGPEGSKGPWWTLGRVLEILDGPDTEPRAPKCECHLEAGDSPCRVHGEDDRLRDLSQTEQTLQTAALDAMLERDQLSDMLKESQLDRINLAERLDQLQAEVDLLRAEGQRRDEQTLRREVDRLRNLAANACTLAMHGMNHKRAKEILAEVNRKL